MVARRHRGPGGVTPSAGLTLRWVRCPGSFSSPARPRAGRAAAGRAPHRAAASARCAG